jgi:hypothetical protein
MGGMIPAPIRHLWLDTWHSFFLRTCNPMAPHYGAMVIKRATIKGLWQ